MKNEIDDTKKIVIGVVIGGIVGGMAYYLWSASQQEKPVLNKLGRAISGVGDILKESTVDDRDDAIDEIGKTIPKGDHVNNVLTWIATGIHLWKKIKKGM